MSRTASSCVRMMGSLRGGSRIRHFFKRIMPLQRFTEEEAQCRNVIADGSYALLSLVQQIELIGTDLVGPELIGRSMEIVGKALDRLDVSSNGSRRIISTLEFGQHQVSKMGHKNLLVTRSCIVLSPQVSATRVASAARAASF